MKRYKFTLNPYGGCAFACEYCYARFFAPTPQQQADWGSWVLVKANARELIASACADGTLVSGDAVYMSSVTDPYQPIERKAGITRAVLEAMLEAGVQPRLTIQTRSPIVTRDLDLLRQFERLRVNFTVTTDDEAVRLRYKPHAPANAVRLHAAAEVAAAGIRIGLSLSPLLPLRDIEAFGAHLASLDADEYVSQYLKSGRSRFAAGTTSESMQRAREDGWGLPQYRAARQRLAAILGPDRPLLEGAEGYAPA